MTANRCPKWIANPPMRLSGCWLLAAGICLCFWLPAEAQVKIPGLGGEDAPATAASQPAALSPVSLEQTLAAARERLQNFQSLLEATPVQQLGGTDEEALEKATLLGRQILSIEQHLLALHQLEETRLASQDLKDKVTGWKGFSVSPPYPLSLLDELRDSIVAQKIQIEKDKTFISLSRQEQERARESLSEAQKRRRQVMEMLEKPAVQGDQLRRGWLDELARLQEAVARATVLSAEARFQAAEAALALHNEKLAFFERQLEVAAAAPAEFTEDELQRRLADIAGKEKKLNAEQLRLSRQSNQVEARLTLARQNLQQARSTAAPLSEEEPLQETLELRKAQSDNISMQAEFLKIRAIMLMVEKLIWEERYRVAKGVSDVELEKIEGRLDNANKRLQEYRSYLESGLYLVQKQALSQRQRLTSLTTATPLREAVQNRLGVYVERNDYLLEALASLDEIIRLNQLFFEEVQSQRQQAGLQQRLESIAARVWEQMRRLWTYEVFVAEETILVEGQKVTRERPVTIGKLAVALAILVAGLWLAFKLRDRTRSLVACSFKLEAAAALLVEKVLTLLVVIAVFVFALISVKIPLTIFAFMGGALAIGIGFGAQNLINNFISGLILLIERPIKVGDVVEVEGSRGRVMEIGARCSLVRRADGFDVLVPNSEFLQKNVINLTLSDERIRLSVQVGVAYDSATRDVAQIMSATLAEHGKILKQPEPVVLFEDFGDSALVFAAYFWVQVSPTGDYRIIASDYRHMLARRFADAGIVISFPQLDVHLDRVATSPSSPGKGQASGERPLSANGLGRKSSPEK